MGDRLAVLVIHGMGTQKPYETLDQFARGVESLLNPPKQLPSYSRTLEYREHPSDPAKQQKHWTQAIVRFHALQTQDSEQPALIDLIEYYWAPIINGRVKALESLQFLIRSALSPFDYLRENLIAIAEVSGRSGKMTPGAVKEGFPSTSNGEIIHILIREIFRSVFIFFPMILLIAGIYALLAQPLLNAIAPKNGGDWLTYFWSGKLSWVAALEVTLATMRWLMLLMTGKFLLEAFFHKDSPDAKLRKLLFRCNLLVGFVFLMLIALPFLDRIWNLIPIVFHWMIATAAHSVPPASNYRQPLESTRHWVRLRVVFVPFALRLVHIFEYLFLAALTYLISRFLTTAIGDLAVYLGSDALSANFVARSQVLEECTQTVRGLLDYQDDLVPDRTPIRYDRVVLAAHSLGSVIAYDVLNDLMAQDMASIAQDQSLRQISGLFTFGCPLNKVYYFFRSRTSPKTYVLDEILYALHNFRLRDSPPAGILPSPDPFHPDFKWLNAWCPKDVISGRMLFYQADENRIVKQGFEPATAHVGYWKNPQLYDFFAGFLRQDK